MKICYLKNTYFLYYGGADKYVGVATIKKKRVREIYIPTLYLVRHYFTLNLSQKRGKVEVDIL